MRRRRCMKGQEACYSNPLRIRVSRTLVVACGVFLLAGVDVIAGEFCEAPPADRQWRPLNAMRDARCIAESLPAYPEPAFLVDVSDLPDRTSSWVSGAHKLRIEDLPSKRWVPRDATLFVLGGGVTRASEERLCARLVAAGFEQAQVLRGGVIRAARSLGLAVSSAPTDRLLWTTPADAFEGVEGGDVRMVDTMDLAREDGSLRLDALADLYAQTSIDEPLLLSGREADYALILAAGALPANVFLLEGGPDAYRMFLLDRAYADASRGGSLQRCAAPY